MQVSIWLVRAIISAVEHAGTPRAQFLASAQLDADLIEDAEAQLAVDDYVRVIEAALAVTGDPALGLRLGQYASSAMYHVVAHVVEHAPTLGDGIETIMRYSGILAKGFEPCLVEQHELAALRLPYLMGDSGAVGFTAEFVMTGFMRMLRQYLGESIRPERACFAYSAPAHAGEYRHVFAGTECFDRSFTQLEFPRVWLTRSQPFANASLYRLLQSHAERELSRMRRAGTIAERVERVLAVSDPRQLPTMNSVARQLDISARTLARKLQAQGVAYAQLVEDRRSSAAKSLLEAQRLTIQEVACALGFADAPAFHKAFRRWTGLTPRQYVASVG